MLHYIQYGRDISSRVRINLVIYVGMVPLQEARALLSLGTIEPNGERIRPFVFSLGEGRLHASPTAGLEGFLYGEERSAKLVGREMLLRHLPDYARYLGGLFAPVAWAQEACNKVQNILHSPLPPQARYGQLMDFLSLYTQGLRREMAAADKSRWSRQARIYEIFPRAFNLAGKRMARGRAPGTGRPFFADFGAQDLLDIKALGFDAVWVMGIFPIGLRNRSGSAGGSPYSIRDHEALNPELGTADDFRGFVDRAHQAGLKVIMDFVPNHTSMDSKLLMNHPEFFLNKRADPAGPEQPDRGFFTHTDPATGRKLWVRHGGYGIFGNVEFWIDTAQVDYSQPGLRREMIRIVKSWVERFNVDGFRVDMAYLDLNANFSRTWDVRMPQQEFMDELIAAVKAAYPATAFIAEGYDNWDELSIAGFDLIYSKNNMDRPGGHTGWYDALHSRCPGCIQAAIERAEYLQWQTAGSAALHFFGNHDEASPQRSFGPWTQGASFLTLLMPGSHLFYGSQEIGFDRPDPREPKSIPFCAPVTIDWQSAKSDTAQFYEELFRTAQALREIHDNPILKALRPQGDPAWVGYALLAPEKKQPAVLVLANPTERSVAVDFHDEESGLAWLGQLPPYGYSLLETSAGDQLP